MKTNNTITEDKLKSLKKMVREQLSKARHKILIQYPFIGAVGLRMDLIPVRDVRVRTACTDGHDVYFDISFFNSLTPDERVFVLAHEIWHAVMLHLVRRHNRIHELFNIATDLEVNNMLQQDGLKPPTQVLLPTEKQKGKSAEEIYEMLLKEAKQHANSKSKPSSSKDGKSGSGSRNSDLSGQFDKHIYDEDPTEKPENIPSITDEYGEVGIDSDFRPSISKDFADKMREAIVAAAQSTEKTAGSIPSHIRELVDKLTTPEIDWKERLAQFVTRSFAGSRRTWIPPNRRHIHRNIYLQRQQSEKIRAVVAIDTSGSTLGDRAKFLSEINGLVESFGDYELTVICCDCQVDSCETYTPDNPLDIKNDGFEVCGGGGTSFLPPFEHVLDNQIECDVFLYLTDGFGEAPKTNPLGIPVMWIVSKNGTEEFCDWGEMLHLTTDDNDID